MISSFLTSLRTYIKSSAEKRISDQISHLLYIFVVLIINSDSKHTCIILNNIRWDVLAHGYKSHINKDTLLKLTLYDTSVPSSYSLPGLQVRDPSSSSGI